MPAKLFTRVLLPTRRQLRAALVVAATVPGLAHASAQGLDGSVLLRTCQAAAQVKALSVICQTYINGFLDTAAYFEKGSSKRPPSFCLAQADKERIPAVAVAWLNAHPDYLKQPAPAALQKALADNFPCKAK